MRTLRFKRKLNDKTVAEFATTLLRCSPRFREDEASFIDISLTIKPKSDPNRYVLIRKSLEICPK